MVRLCRLLCRSCRRSKRRTSIQSTNCGDSHRSPQIQGADRPVQVRHQPGIRRWFASADCCAEAAAAANAVRLFNRRTAATPTDLLKYRVLTGLYRFAISRGYVDGSPLPIAVPKLPPQQTPYVYSIDELRRLPQISSNTGC